MAAFMFGKKLIELGKRQWSRDRIPSLKLLAQIVVVAYEHGKVTRIRFVVHADQRAAHLRAMSQAAPPRNRCEACRFHTVREQHDADVVEWLALVEIAFECARRGFHV